MKDQYLTTYRLMRTRRKPLWLSVTWACGASLDEGMIGAHFAFDTASVVGRFAMKKLIAVVVAQGDHVFHPKMVGEGTDLARGLFGAVVSILKRRP